MQTNNGDNLSHQPIVVHDCTKSKEIHRELFHFDESAYVQAGENILDFLYTMPDNTGNVLHIAGDWQTLVKLLTWNNAPGHEQSLAAMSAITSSIDAFSDTASLDNLFSEICRGGYIAPLRALSAAAARVVQKRFNGKWSKVEFHLISLDDGIIVTSSL